MAVEESKTPVTVIAGYLGAGKTTLINACLQTRGERKIAVLVNDFGDINIDAALIESQTDTVLNLAGGCVCCSIGSDFLDALSEFAAVANKFDHVLVETSGVALPKPIAQTIALSQSFELDAIFVLADSETIEKHLRDPYVGDLVLQQLQQADCVLLTKADLVNNDRASASPTPAGSPDAAVRLPISPSLFGPDFSGSILSLPRSAYSCEWLLGVPKTSAKNWSSSRTLFGKEDSNDAQGTDQPPRYISVGATSSATQTSTELFESLAIELDAPLNLELVKKALLTLGIGPRPLLIRAKGFVVDRESPSRWQLLQMVGQRLTLSDLAPQPASNPEPSIVLILIGLRREMLSRQKELDDFITLLQK